MNEWYCAGCGESEVSERGAFCARCRAGQGGADLAAENARLRQQVAIARAALKWYTAANELQLRDNAGDVAGNALAAIEDEPK